MAYVSLDTEQVKRANKKHKYTKEQVIQLEKCMDEKTGPLYEDTTPNERRNVF
jgi:hypothetical protein